MRRQATIAVPQIIGVLIASGLLVLAVIGVWYVPRGVAHSPISRSHKPFAHEFVANAGMFGRGVTYWSASSLGETYVLEDGRLLHALPAESPHKERSRTRRIWAIVESLAASGHFSCTSGVRDGRYTYIGPQKASATPIDRFETLKLTEAWPGIDLTLRQVDSGIERVYTVLPGSSPERIRVVLDGARDARVDDRGGLSLTAGVGEIRYAPPAAYQTDRTGRRVNVPVSYRVLPGGQSFGFDVGHFDAASPLVIDPVLQGTYLGDGASQSIYAMAIDASSGDVLVAGDWEFGTPPKVAGGFQTTGQVSSIFVTRSDAKLENVIQSTILGGSTAEDATALAVDPNSGDVYVGGTAESPDFPGGGGNDEPVMPLGTLGTAFVSRLSADLHRLEQTTYFSASPGSNRAWDIAVSPTTGDVYVTGSVPGGALVARYDHNLLHVLSRYVITGNVNETGEGLAINPSNGDVYVAGLTHSWTLPKIAGGAFRSSTHPAEWGFERVFVARLDATLSTHLQSTYLWDGPAREFYAFRIPITIDALSGDVLVAAATNGDVGAIVGGGQTAFAGGNSDGIVVRFSADLTQVHGATYFGGENDEILSGIGTSADGQSVYIGGYSNSTALPGSPLTPPRQYNAFVARLNADLSAVPSTIIYYGKDYVYGWAMRVHPLNGEPYLAGATYADDLVGTQGGFQPVFGTPTLPTGSYDSYIARFDPQVTTTDRVVPEVFGFPTLSGVTQGSPVTSRAIRIYGYTTGVPISVSNGSYSLDGGAFTSADGTLQPGQTVQLRHTAAVAPGGTTRTTLTVGGVNGTFDSVAQSGSTVMPVAFTLDPKTSVPIGVWMTSNAIAVQGTNAPAPISVTGGEYSIDGGAFTADPGKVYSGQTVIVGQTAAPAPGVQTDTTLNIGGRGVTFTMVTEPPRTLPHAFAFLSLTPPYYNSITPDSDVGSPPAVVIGINGPAAISVAGGQYSVNGGPWTSAPGTVNNLDIVDAQVHTGPAGSIASATVTIDGVDGTFSAGALGLVPADQVPQAFSIHPINGVEPYQWIEAQPVTLTGFTAPAQVTFGLPPGPIGGADVQWYDANLKEFVPVGLIRPGDPLRLRLMPVGYDTTVGTMVNVGGAEALVTVSTIAQGGSATPTAFEFQDHTGVTVGSVVTTESVQLKGLGVASSVSVSGCTVSITDGPFGTGGTVLNGDTLVLKINAPSASGQTTNGVVTVGSYSDTVSVSTAASSSSGGGSSGGSGSSGGGSGGGGALNGWALLGLGGLILGRRRGAHRSSIC